VSVNLSEREFRQPTLAEDVDAVLRRTGLNPRSLVLEVAESFPIDEAPHVVSTVQKLRNLGVKLALDDFGLEGSSFSYLERLPVDVLKIDRSLIDRLGRSDSSAERLVSAMVGFARDMGIQTVAEGVETARQLGELSDMGCELAQGFYFWEPMPGPAATELLSSNRGS
jgi:EAL domain-containing protein (putative c-di-GMP-specific phosphodiesterase class I)